MNMMRFLSIFLLFCCFHLNGQLTVTNDSTKIVIYDAMARPVPFSKVRVNGIEFFPSGKFEDGVYSAPVSIDGCRVRYNKCFIEVFHPDFIPYSDSVLSMFPVMLSHGDDNYIYEINKR